MANVQAGLALYLEKYKDQHITCSPYALAKLGVDKAHCSIKLEGYVIPCVPFRLAFNRLIFSGTVTKQELSFFQKYVNTNVGVSLALNPDNRNESQKFSFRCPLTKIGQMKGRDDKGLFVIELKTAPDDLIYIIGSFLETHERLNNQFEKHGTTPVKITSESAKMMGYTMQAVINEQGSQARRIQIYSISTKAVEFLEPAGATVHAPGKTAAYQFVFTKSRVSVAGTVTESSVLPQGAVRTAASLEFCPELIRIIDDYWTTAGKPPVTEAYTAVGSASSIGQRAAPAPAETKEK